jgi:tRNA (pseudouridine54-N1)-methyltransferase
MRELGGFDDRALLGKVARALDVSRVLGKEEERPVESGVSVRTIPRRALPALACMSVLLSLFDQEQR